MRIRFYLCLLLSFMAHLGMAQKGTISGQIRDSQSNETLPGVNILVKNSNQGAITDIDGNFTLQASPDDVLVISFVGYNTEEVSVGNQSTIQLSLTLDLKTLNEVVVVGYGTTKKKEFTGAVSVVNAQAIEGLNPTRIEQALQGQVAGVNITTASGSPGGALNIRIRGLSTNENNNPLILVDGVPYSSDGLAALNPNDIESINVLKDATAGIYGVQAANGVVLITTKKGKRNSKPSINFDGYYGVQETTRKLNLLNAREFAVLKNETFAAGQKTPPYNNTNLGEGTDWQNEVFQSAPIQNYNLSVQGGSEKTNYSIGGSFLDQKGIIGGDKSGFRRYNGRINFQTELVKNLTLENVLLYTNENRKTLPENSIGSVLFNTINASPLDPVRNENGRYTYLMTVNDIINPLAQIENSFNESKVNKLVGKQELAYKINSNFTLSGRAGYNYALVDYKEFSPLVFYGNGKAQNSAIDENLTPNTTQIGELVIPVLNNVTERRTSYFNYNLEAFLNYNKVFADRHEVKATLGTSVFEDREEELEGTAFDIPYNSWEFADISAADNASLLNTTTSTQQQSRLQSFFGRAEYAYDGKYIVSAILRRDASSRFGKNNRFGYFPAASAAWVVSDEAFFTPEFINFLKVRASYGISGNDRIGNFRYRALLDGEGNYVFNDNIVSGVALGTVGNEDLKWEQTTQTNIGLDFDLFKGRVNVSTDYFIKSTKDLLFQPDVSGVLGAYGPGSLPPWVNAGNVRNKGFEFLIGYEDKIGKDFTFNANYNLTTIKNEVTAMAEGINFLSRGAFGVGGANATRMEAGYPLGYFFGYKTAGVFQSEEEIAESAVNQPGAKPGDLIYVDHNGDGSINFSDNSDKTLIGSPIPDFLMGFNLSLDYKGIDVSTNLYASIGNEIVRNYERQQPLANLLHYNVGRWTGPGSSNDLPRLTTDENRNGVISDYFVEDGSFLRMKNLQIGYSFPAQLLEKVGVGRLRIYISANNLFTLTGYKGYDPDFSSSNALESGIDYGFYPQARTIMTGINLNF